MARISINTRKHTKEKPYLINSYFLSKLVRQKTKTKTKTKNQKPKTKNQKTKNKTKKKKKKKTQDEQNACMYVSEICAEGIFVTFSW